MTVLNRRSPYRNWRMDQAWGQNFTVNRASPQYDGLVAWWPLGPGQYGMIRDVLGRWHMTAVNTPNLVRDGQRGVATLFDDGSSERLFGTTPVTGAPFTISAWLNDDEGFGGGDRAIVSMCDTASENNTFLLYINNAPQLFFFIQDAGGVSQAATGATVSANAWHHACAVEAANNDHRVYLDGGNKGTNGGGRTPASVDTAGIGVRNKQTPDLYFSGRINDVRIRNRALSDAEVHAEYADPWDLWLPTKRAFFMVVPAAPVGAIMNQIQFANLGADLYNGALI